ncbi:MAG: hypothetical protein GXP48_05910 [Acidobacteria bacterium]|nr:hypothetical protein [Acidobacteriota bacterium]
MGRKPRILVPGAVYHVYNRVSSGERVFESPGVAERFLGILRDVKGRDGWTVLAWCLMSSHYHLVVRSGEVPLSHGLHRLQNLFSRWFNREAGRSGPLWQSRYHAKVIGDEGYLWQSIVYIHLNPVRAGVVGKPGEYRHSGHREMLRVGSGAIVDRDQALLCFGQTRRSALRQYRLAVDAAVAQVGGAEGKTQPADTLGEEPDVELWFDPRVPYLDVLGRSSVEERPRVSAGAFVEAAFGALGLAAAAVRSRTKDRQVVKARRLAVALAIERWGLRPGQLAVAMGRPAQQVSAWGSEGARLRASDPALQIEYDVLDRDIKRKLKTWTEGSAGTKQ